MNDTVKCDSCYKIIEKKNAIDISDDDSGVILCRDCYDGYSRYLKKKTKKESNSKWN